MTNEEQVRLHLEAAKNVDLYRRNRYKRGARGKIRGRALLRVLDIYEELIRAGAGNGQIVEPGVELR